MNQCLPSLSLDGFINNKDILMVKLFELFMASEHSQSNIFEGHVMSLKYILDHNNTPGNIEDTMEMSLDMLYSHYFNSTDIEVIVNEYDNSSTYEITISIICTDEYGNTYTFDKSLHNISSEILTFDTQLEYLYKG